jgi:GNAT superfamily N-acetyltransferase
VFTLRLATREDIPSLRDLIPASVRSLARGYYSPEQIEASLAEIFGVDTQLIEDGTYFVAESLGRVVGAGGWSDRRTLFGGDQRKGDRPEERIDPATEPARIRAFYVLPAMARQGIGRRILETCEAAARGKGFRRLELLATLPGVPLYAALGYRDIRPMDVAMRGGLTLPCIVMGKDLLTRDS